jgi:hypothetical protein
MQSKQASSVCHMSLQTVAAAFVHNQALLLSMLLHALLLHVPQLACSPERGPSS